MSSRSGTRSRLGAAVVVEDDVAAFAGQLPSVLFEGYDHVRGKVRSIAVKGETHKSDSNNGLYYGVCSDMDMVMEALEINESFSLFANIFDQKAKFVNDLNLQRYSICIVIRATKTAMETTVNSTFLDALPIEQNHFFFNGYGDSFVSKIVRGAEYCAIFLYNCETLERQKHLKIEMKCQGIFDTVPAKEVSLQRKLNKFNLSKKTQLSFHQRLSGIANVALPTAENAIDFALRFSSMPVSHPEVIHFEITGYETVPGMSSKMLHKIVSNRNFICDNLRSTLCRLQQLLKDINSIEEIYKFYTGTSGDAYYNDVKLMEVKSEAKKDLQTVLKIIKDYTDDPINVNMDMNLEFGSLRNGSPSLNCSVHNSPRFGANNENTFDNIDSIEEYLHGLTRISGLQLQAGKAIYLLSITYTSEKNNESRKENNGTRSLAGHSAIPEILIPKGVSVVSVAGFYRRNPLKKTSIKKLDIRLSNGQVISGGREKGNSFHWEVPQGCFVLGFHGRFDILHFDQLEIVYASFQPAHWN